MTGRSRKEKKEERRLREQIDILNKDQSREEMYRVLRGHSRKAKLRDLFPF